MSRPSTTRTLHSRQPSPVWAVRKESTGMNRSFDIPLITLLKELPSTTPTASFIMSSRKANLLYASQSSLFMNCLSCDWNESDI